MIDVITPAGAEELAAALREAIDRAVVPWGAGTLQHLGAAPPAEALRLCTTALDQVLEYNPPDLTITVQAGVTLEAVQAMLARYGQWLPWLPPAPGSATIGGLLAAGADGPLRLGYGAPRDWVLGMRVALADGRLVKSGGKVVKNVAGYDLHKVQIGALGTLGVIVEATFKVAPRPERLGALLVGCATRTQALELAVRLRKWPLTPASLALIAGRAVATFADVLPDHRSHTLVAARFDGVPAAVERQMRAAAECAKDLGAWYTELGDDHVDALWQRLALFSAPLEERQSELLLRAAARPAELPAVLTALERGAPGEEAWAVGYGGVGLAQAGWPIMGDTASALARLRAGLAALEGYAVVEAVPADVRSHLDIWGAPPTTLPLMRALKNQWDPYRILNRGRYVGGI